MLPASSSQPLWAAGRRTLAEAAHFPAPPDLTAAVASSPLVRRGRKDHWWLPKVKVVLPRATEAEVNSIERSASAARYPEYNRLLPCPLHNKAPRIEHLVVSEGGNVLEYISKALHLPSMTFGCVQENIHKFSMNAKVWGSDMKFDCIVSNSEVGARAPNSCGEESLKCNNWHRGAIFVLASKYEV